MASVTPMMQQYLDTKAEYKDCILFFRLGDFYEMFFDDARTASRELELTLTGKDCGLSERAPMCGVPYHAVDTYVEKLIERGLDGLMRGRTVFVIAHRLSTVRNSDVIMVLDHGRIIERGSHEKLIAEKGQYYQLYTGQAELA